MNQSESQKLFWELFRSETEDEVEEIVRSNPLTNNPQNWYPYGGNTKDDRSNFATFENQQPHPIPALVEKLTNSIDALLMLECRKQGINPESSGAPYTMEDAVQKFLGIKNGDFSEVGEKRRREIASRVQVIASGDKKKPSILIYDDGEGQDPDDFPTTFLSLHRSNKTKIHFVQGKYNMGSTGAVVFCGQHRYQLIASKRANALLHPSKPNYFGFTLVRVHPLSPDEEIIYRNSWYEYLCVDGIIPRFDIDGIDLDLVGNREFVTGSVVKLYSYSLPEGFRSDATVDLWRGLNRYLYQPALPFLVADRRFNANAKHDSKLVLGNKTRIVIDDKEKKQIETITSQIQNKEMGKIYIEATLFKPDVSPREFIGSYGQMAVVFTVNGQVHGTLTRSFISQDLGFSFLQNSLLIQVNCTYMRTTFRQDLFMANRTNVKESESFADLRKVIASNLKNNEQLKNMNELRKQGILRENSGDEDIIRSLFKSAPLDKDLIDLLKKDGGIWIDNLVKPKEVHTDKSNTTSQKPFSASHFPSIFKIDSKENAMGKKVKNIPLNGKGEIRFITDVENEYLFRPHEKGEFQIQILDDGNNELSGGNAKGSPKKVSDVFDVEEVGPTEGIIKVSLKPREPLQIGEEVKLSARLTSPNGDIEQIFFVKVIKPNTPTLEQPIKQEPQTPNLPKLVRVYEKSDNHEQITWGAVGIKIDDIVKIHTASNENELVIDTILINMDSSTIKKYLSKNRVKTAKNIEMVRDKYCTSIYFHSIFLYGILYQMSKSKTLEHEIDNIGGFVENLMKSYGKVILYREVNPDILKLQDGD